MSVYGASVTRLIEEFEKLPGVGHKSAQRLAFYMMGRTEKEVEDFAAAVVNARRQLRFCSVCQNMSDKEVCDVCSNGARDKTTICVVEDPRDVMAMERAREFNGVYHVLHGAISPMSGIGAEDIRIKELLTRIGQNGDIREIIIATGSGVEGEATAMYIARLIKPMGVKVTRIAQGVPIGSDLEYTDEVTLARALQARREM